MTAELQSSQSNGTVAGYARSALDSINLAEFGDHLAKNDEHLAKHTEHLAKYSEIYGS